MQTEKIKKTVSCSLTAICMAVIFWLSSRTAAESAEQSGSVLSWIINIFGDGIFTDFLVRKSAHCLEYTGLCFLMNFSLLYTRSKKSPALAVLFTSLYAVTDEIHQIFVDGRSCQISDWAIDTMGAVIGTIGFLIIILIIERIKKKH